MGNKQQWRTWRELISEKDWTCVSAHFLCVSRLPRHCNTWNKMPRVILQPNFAFVFIISLQKYEAKEQIEQTVLHVDNPWLTNPQCWEKIFTLPPLYLIKEKGLWWKFPPKHFIWANIFTTQKHKSLHKHRFLATEDLLQRASAP